MSDLNLYEQLKNGDFEAILSTLNSIQTFVSGVSTIVTSIQSEVSGTSKATPSANSFVGTIHSPARLDPSTQNSIEKFVGDYFFGDQNTSSDSQSETQSATLAFGPTSQLLLNFLPVKSNHAVTKRFVENLVSPLYSKINNLQNTTKSLQQTSNNNLVTSVYATYSNSRISTQIDLIDSDLISGSEDHENYFILQDHQHIKFLQSGVYSLSIHCSNDSPDCTIGHIGVFLKGKEIGILKTHQYGDSLTFFVYIEEGTLIDFYSKDTLIINNVTLSIMKLGDM